jgi:hypothetical protein
MSFMEPAEFERAEVDVLDAVVDVFQAHVLPGADSGNIDPIRVPADTAMRTANRELKDLVVKGVVLRHGAGRSFRYVLAVAGGKQVASNGKQVASDRKVPS